MVNRQSGDVVLFSILVLVGMTGLAVAAGTTGVILTPTDQSIETGASADYSVVVANADGGVGAYNITIEIQDPTVAQISAVSLPSDPVIRDITYAEDRSRVQMEVVGLETADTGSVTAATVTLNTSANAEGTSAISLTVAALGDEAGNSYTISYTESATVQVGESGSSDGTGNTGSGSSGEDSDSSSSTTDTSTTSSTATETATTSPPITPTSTPADTATQTVTTSNDTLTPPTESPTTTSTSMPGFNAVTMLLTGCLLLVVLRSRK